MQRTARLYHEQPDLRTFEARVLERRAGPGGAAEVILDRTAFYPTGGGQPHDRGTLGNCPVLDVLEEGEMVVHRVQGDLPAGPVRGAVDWDRRLDHRQQHTGQHILSRALADVAGAATVGFHLGSERCSIDLDREDLDEGALDKGEGLANRVVLEDVPVEARWYEDPADIPSTVRKEAPETGRIRIVTVGEFDANPCCGTHCARSGEVGPIKILRTGRRKGGLRVEFVCGSRALEDYRARHRLLRETALALTTEEGEVPQRVLSLLSENRTLRARLEKQGLELRDRLYREWSEEASEAGFARDVGEGRVAWLAPLAGELGRQRGEPVLLYSREGGTVQIVVGAPEVGSRGAGEMLRDLLESTGGRGGGSRRLAQGMVSFSELKQVLRAWPRIAEGEGRS